MHTIALRFCSLVVSSFLLAACGGEVVVDPPAGGDPSAGAGGMSSEWTNGIPPLHTEGRWLKDAAGKTVTLRGVALADLHDVDTQRAPMNVDKLLDLVSDASQGWYARVVRFTVFPDIWLQDPDAYLKEHLIPAIEHAALRKLYVIVDWHEISDPLVTDARTRQFWTQVAPRLAGYSHVLIEVFNEVQSTNGITWAGFKQVAQPWVDLIRASAKSQVILIGGPFWDQQIGGAATDPFAGDNLAYVGHIYPTIDPAVWGPNGEITRAAQVRPVMITEWGYEAGGTIPTDGTQSSFGEPLKAYVEANRLSWTAWCADTIWGPPIFDAEWQARAGEGVMGRFAQQWLADTKDVP